MCIRDSSYGNSVTTPQDLKRPVEADATMLALCESVAGRLRMDGKTARVIKMCIRDRSYVLYSLTQDQLAHTLFPLGGMHKDATAAVPSRT